MIYTEDASYSLFLIEQYKQELETKRFINQCIATIQDKPYDECVEIYTEELKMDKKSLFQRFKEFIKRIFDKFVANMDAMIKKDRDFIIKYKDIIYDKKYDTYTINNMPKYEDGIKNILEYNFPVLNINEMLELDQNGMHKKFMENYDGETEFKEYCNRFFLCNNQKNQEKVESGSLDMKQIYDFCYNQPEYSKKLTDLKNEYQKQVELAEKETVNAAKEYEEKQRKANVTNSTESKNESTYKKSLLNTLLENDNKQKEAETKINSDPKANESNDKTDDKLDLGVNSTQKEDPSKNSDTRIDDSFKDKKEQINKEVEDSKKKADNIEKTCQTYLTAYSTVMSARISAYDKICKEYMKILKYHVKLIINKKAKNGPSSATEQDSNNIRELLKKYRDATGDDKEKAADDVISYYKTKFGMAINASDVESLVAKNKDKL